MKPETCIYIVGQDENTGDLVRGLAASLRVDCRVYLTAEQFLDASDRETPGCVIAEIQLPGISGVELQQRMADERVHLPVVFVTDSGEVRIAVEAMRGGAVTVLRKPIAELELRTAIGEALSRAAETRRIDAAHTALRRQFSELSRQERAVLRLMLTGRSSNRIATELDVGVPTVDACVESMLKKTQTATLVDLARLALQADLGTEDV